MNRFTLIHIGRLHIRIHTITSEDKTPFLHNHPFFYLSIVLKGGYIEESETGIKKFNFGSFIFRTPHFFHRLKKVINPTITLFITWETPQYKWKIKPLQNSQIEWTFFPKGIYIRNIQGADKFCKFDDFWHVSSHSLFDAENSTQPSINQTQPGKPFFLFLK